jgi:hypothetical protein
MNKRGFLLAEETLKLIIAVIAIGFLAYLLISLYFSAKTSKDLGLAKESLQFLISEINSGKTKVDIYNPEGWQVSTWASISGPKTCSNLGGQLCICICKENTAESCDENGICLNNEKGLITAKLQSIEIEDPPITLNIDYINKKISKSTFEDNGAGAGFGGGGGGGF